MPPLTPERRGRFERNLRLYPLFSAVIFTPIMLPIIVLFWEENGLDMLDIFVLQSLFALAMVLLEVPTGMVADRMGKRTSLLAGAFIILVGLVVYAMGHGFGVFLLAEILLALGVALLSGADASMLYDSLAALGRTAEYTRREGRARALQMTSFAVSNLLGGFIGSVDYRSAMWASAIGPALGLLVALRFTEVQTREADESIADAWRGYRVLVGQTLKFVRKHSLVRWQIAFMAVLIGGQSWLLWLYQPYMTHVGLPVWAFGIAFAGFNLFAAFVSSRAHTVEEMFGDGGALVVIGFLQVAPPLLMAIFVHPAAILLILGHQSARGLMRPVINERILRYTYADKRSTVLSVASLSGRLFFAVTAPVMGWVVRSADLSAGLLTQGATLAVLMAGLFVGYRRIPEKYFRVKESVAEQQEGAAG